MPVYTDENGFVVFDPSNGEIHNSEPAQYPDIVTDGLLLWLDGSDSPVGGEWVDLSGNNNNLTLGGGTLQDGTTNGGVYRIGTSTLDTLYRSSNIIGGLSNYTIMGAARYLSTSGNGRIYSNYAGSVNWVLSWNGNPEYYYSNGWVAQQGSPDTNWRIQVTSNSGGSNGKWKINDISQSVNFNTFAAPYGISLGNEYSTGFSEHSNCEIGFLLMYNKQLSDAEMTQNFNAYKSRYGL